MHEISINTFKMHKHTE